MRRPIYVKQRENGEGEFWYTVQGGNAENVLTSKMFRERWRAVRGARAFIKSVSPAPVIFQYWVRRGSRLDHVVQTTGGTS